MLASSADGKVRVIIALITERWGISAGANLTTPYGADDLAQNAALFELPQVFRVMLAVPHACLAEDERFFGSGALVGLTTAVEAAEVGATDD